jgi:Zn-dependent peptidase ImmA (M78 family)
MDEFDDYPVPPRSDKELEEIADEIRRRLGFAGDETPTALEILARFQERCAVELKVRPDCEMGRKEAYLASKPARLFVRESTYEAMKKDQPRARMTLLHEIAHYFLHPGAPKARMADGNATPKFIKPPESAERQARVVAAAILMPRLIVSESSSSKHLQERCRASAEAAEIRFARLRHKTARPELPEVRRAIDRLKATPTSSSASSASITQAARMKAWARARHVEGENPLRVRRSDDDGFGYRIEWRDFNNPSSPFGWFLDDGRALAYYPRSKPLVRDWGDEQDNSS